MTNIDEYANFTQSVWFSRHKTDCAVFAMGRETGYAHNPDAEFCTCDQDPERSLTIASLGLSGEVGEVMEILKKRIRDGRFDRDKLIKELGDVAYYWTRICKHFEVKPSEVLETNKIKLQDRMARGKIAGSGDNR